MATFAALQDPSQVSSADAPARLAAAQAANAAYLSGTAPVLPKMGTPPPSSEDTRVIAWDTSGLTDPKNQQGRPYYISAQEDAAREDAKHMAAFHPQEYYGVNIGSMADVPLSVIATRYGTDLADIVQGHFTEHPTAKFQAITNQYAQQQATTVSSGGSYIQPTAISPRNPFPENSAAGIMWLTQRQQGGQVTESLAAKAISESETVFSDAGYKFSALSQPSSAMAGRLTGSKTVAGVAVVSGMETEPIRDLSYEATKEGGGGNTGNVYERIAMQNVVERPGYTLPKDLGDITTQRVMTGYEAFSEAMGMVGIRVASPTTVAGQVLEAQREAAYATPSRRDETFFMGELQKWAENYVETASAYHHVGMEAGVPIPANRFEYQGDLAVEFLKGAPVRASEFFSPVSGEMSQHLPGGEGVQQYAWREAVAVDRINEGKPAQMPEQVSFMDAVKYLGAAEGKYGPYGVLWGAEKDKVVTEVTADLIVGHPVEHKTMYPAPFISTSVPAATTEPPLGKEIVLPDASITGGIQPKMLEASAGGALRESGLVEKAGEFLSGASAKVSEWMHTDIYSGKVLTPAEEEASIRASVKDAGISGGIIGQAAFGEKSPEVIKGALLSGVDFVTGIVGWTPGKDLMKEEASDLQKFRTEKATYETNLQSMAASGRSQFGVTETGEIKIDTSNPQAVKWAKDYETAQSEYKNFMQTAKDRGVIVVERGQLIENPDLTYDYGEFSKWGIGAGAQVRQTLGFSKEQLEAYGYTVEQKQGIENIPEKIVYGAGYTFSTHPEKIVSAYVGGGLMVLGGEVVVAAGEATGATAALGGIAAAHPTAAAISGAAVRYGVPLALAGVTYWGASEGLQASPERTTINIGKMTPEIGGVVLGGASAFGALRAADVGMLGYRTDISPTVQRVESAKMLQPGEVERGFFFDVKTGKLVGEIRGGTAQIGEEEFVKGMSKIPEGTEVAFYHTHPTYSYGDVFSSWTEAAQKGNISWQDLVKKTPEIIKGTHEANVMLEYPSAQDIYSMEAMKEFGITELGVISKKGVTVYFEEGRPVSPEKVFGSKTMQEQVVAARPDWLSAEEITGMWEKPRIEYPPGYQPKKIDLTSIEPPSREFSESITGTVENPRNLPSGLLPAVEREPFVMVKGVRWGEKEYTAELARQQAGPAEQPWEALPGVRQILTGEELGSISESTGFGFRQLEKTRTSDIQSITDAWARNLEQSQPASAKTTLMREQQEKVWEGARLAGTGGEAPMPMDLLPGVGKGPLGEFRSPAMSGLPDIRITAEMAERFGISVEPAGIGRATERGLEITGAPMSRQMLEQVTTVGPVRATGFTNIEEAISEGITRARVKPAVEYAKAQEIVPSAQEGAFKKGPSFTAEDFERALTDVIESEKRPAEPAKGIPKVEQDLKKVTRMKVSDINTELQDMEFGPEGKRDVREIAAAIKRGEEIPPILVSEKGYLQDGRHRLLAYKSLGIEDIPVEIGTPQGVKRIPKVEPYPWADVTLGKTELSPTRQDLTAYLEAEARGTLPATVPIRINEEALVLEPKEREMQENILGTISEQIRDVSRITVPEVIPMSLAGITGVPDYPAVPKETQPGKDMPVYPVVPVFPVPPKPVPPEEPVPWEPWTPPPPPPIIKLPDGLGGGSGGSGGVRGGGYFKVETFTFAPKRLPKTMGKLPKMPGAKKGKKT